MMSTITPLAEAGRGRRYSWSAAWFIVGSVVGGATLGAVAGLLSILVRAATLPTEPRLGAVAVLAALAGLCDARVLGPRLPHHRRQVNEQWLDQFRSWVYGAGFGAQIGCGVSTYVMTTGVYLVVAIGALSASPALAVGLGALFGASRGLAILSTSRVRSMQQLSGVHRWFETHEAHSRWLMVAVLGLSAIMLLIQLDQRVAVVVGTTSAAIGLFRSARGIRSRTTRELIGAK